MLRIALTWYEMQQAALVGAMRRISSLNNGHNKYKHAERSDWNTEVEGACAEMAFAKAFGLYWAGGVNTFKEPDVGAMQVRSTSYRNGHLIIRPNDVSPHFALVITSDLPACDVIGWQDVAFAKQDRFWKDEVGIGVGCWWVPQSELHEYNEQGAT